MTKQTKEKAPAVEAPAPAKEENSRPAAAAAPATKGPSGPMMSTAASIAEDGKRPMMSSELPRPSEPEVVPADFSKAVQSAHTEWRDTSDLAVLGRTATPEELAEFRKTVEARRKAERDLPRPADTLWTCKVCGYNCRMGADHRKATPCFRCNPMLSRAGSYMVQLTTPAEVAAFLAKEKAEREAWARNFAKAKEIAARRDQENTVLRKAGL